MSWLTKLAFDQIMVILESVKKNPNLVPQAAQQLSRDERSRNTACFQMQQFGLESSLGFNQLAVALGCIIENPDEQNIDEQNIEEQNINEQNIDELV